MRAAHSGKQEKKPKAWVVTAHLLDWKEEENRGRSKADIVLV